MVSLRVRPVHDSVCVFGPSPATQGACPEFGCAPPDGGWYNKHGRVAMLAFLGLIVPDAFRLPIDGASDLSIDVIDAHNKLIGPGLGEGLMWNLMVVVGAIESVRFKQIGLGFENLTLENAGDLGLRALAPGTEEGMKLVRTQELKNGRLAMLAVGGCLTQAVAFDVHHFPFLK